MVEKFEALVLGYSRFGDKGAVVRCYTREHGQQSFMVYSLHGKKGGMRPSLFMPLSYLSIQSAKSKKGNLMVLKEAKPIEVFNGLHQHPVKNALTLFMAEVLQKMLRQPNTDEAKFDFLLESIRHLNAESERLALFAVKWLLALSAYGGFSPDERSFRPGHYFDLLDGIFTAQIPAHSHVLNEGLSAELHRAITIEDYIPIKLIRQELLDALLVFYKLHVEGFGDLKSPEVLREVFA